MHLPPPSAQAPSRTHSPPGLEDISDRQHLAMRQSAREGALRYPQELLPGLRQERRPAAASAFTPDALKAQEAQAKADREARDARTAQADLAVMERRPAATIQAVQALLGTFRTLTDDTAHHHPSLVVHVDAALYSLMRDPRLSDARLLLKMQQWISGLGLFNAAEARRAPATAHGDGGLYAVMREDLAEIERYLATPLPRVSRPLPPQARPADVRTGQAAVAAVAGGSTRPHRTDAVIRGAHTVYDRLTALLRTARAAAPAMFPEPAPAPGDAADRTRRQRD